MALEVGFKEDRQSQWPEETRKAGVKCCHLKSHGGIK